MKFPKCACIETLFTELPWAKRFRAAREAGFDLVEFWSWTDKDLDGVRDLAREAGVGVSGFNGDADYSLIDPAHRRDYLSFLEKSLAAARKVGALSVTVHSNALGEGGLVANHYPELSDTVKLCAMFDALREGAPLAERAGVTLNLEALNIWVDHRGNYLSRTAMAAEICRLVDSPRLKVLYDVYHMQINEGNLCSTIAAHAAQFGHVHVADVPGRHEPGTGEINYPRVFACLEAAGYSGAVGYELVPKAGTDGAVRAIMACG
ncbi:MAG: TIM barrel protein [Planctomycetota bacterium]|nr:TIM barrel protein [Planctomycetota bacterium]